MKVIAFTGLAGAGKDLAATFFVNEFDYLLYSFAEPLKNATRELFDWPKSRVWGSKSVKEEKDSFWGISGREALQFVGTELVREHMHKLVPDLPKGDFWIRHARRKLEWAKDTGYPGMVICDLRFQNEGDWVVNNAQGLLIEIARPNAQGAVGIDGHASEAGFQKGAYPSSQYVKVVNDGTIDELYTKLEQIYQSHVVNLK